MKHRALVLASAFAFAACAKSEAPSPKAGAAPPGQAPVAASAATEPETPPKVSEPTATPTAAAPTPLEDEKPTSGLGKDKLAGELGTLPEAEKALADAQKQLDTLVGPMARSAGGATPLAAGDTRCPNACKAMDSLRHAADAICRLTSPGDKRCSHAKDVVSSSEKRVSACSCPAP
jgi:hypothetical protein